MDNIISMCSSVNIPLLKKDDISEFLLSTVTNRDQEKEHARFQMLLAWILGDLDNRLEFYPNLAAHLNVQQLPLAFLNIVALKHPKIAQHQVTVNILKQLDQLEQAQSVGVVDPHLSVDRDTEKLDHTNTESTSDLADVYESDDGLKDLTDISDTVGITVLNFEDDIVQEKAVFSIEYTDQPAKAPPVAEVSVDLVDQSQHTPCTEKGETATRFQMNVPGELNSTSLASSSSSQIDSRSAGDIATVSRRPSRSRITQAPVWLSEYVSDHDLAENTVTRRAVKVQRRSFPEIQQASLEKSSSSSSGGPKIRETKNEDSVPPSVSEYGKDSKQEEGVTVTNDESTATKKTSKRGRPAYSKLELKQNKIKKNSN